MSVCEAVDATRRYLATPSGKRTTRDCMQRKGWSYKRAVFTCAVNATGITVYETLTAIT